MLNDECTNIIVQFLITSLKNHLHRAVYNSSDKLREISLKTLFSCEHSFVPLQKLTTPSIKEL